MAADLILSGESKEYSNYDNVYNNNNNIAQQKDPNKDNRSNENNNKQKIEGKLFVIDDDSDIVYVLKHGLQKMGFWSMLLPIQRKPCEVSNQTPMVFACFFNGVSLLLLASLVSS